MTEIRVPAGAKADGDVRAELVFEAAFEEEHGVGVLTDGAAVLGLGYAGEASPFGAG